MIESPSPTREPRTAARALPGRDPRRRRRAARGARQVELPHARSTAASWPSASPRTVDGEVVATAGGLVVRCERPSHATIPLDRVRLATLPGQPPPDVPLVCLDTETTGLATAAGTVAFLVGLGWWEGDRFRQVQLLLPDHADEPALLTALGAAHPARRLAGDLQRPGLRLAAARRPATGMARRAAPVHAGHLDLLPVVRRLFRHRMEDARLRTVEAELLGLLRARRRRRLGDPGRYLGFLRGGPAEPLAAVVRHNDQDVRSLARLLVQLADRLRRRRPRGGRRRPATSPASPARSPASAGSARRSSASTSRSTRAAPIRAARASADGHRSAPRPRSDRRRRPVVVAAPPGGLRRLASGRASVGAAVRPGGRFATPWTTERIAVERAHLLRRLGRCDDAADAWAALAAGPGRTAVVAAIELAKLREHRLRDRPGALDAAVARLGRRSGGAARASGAGPRGGPAVAASIRLRRRVGPRLDGREVTAVRPVTGQRLDRPPTCETSLGTTARRTRSRARRTRTAARSGTPSSPGPSTTSDPAAAANRRSGGRRDRCRPTIAGRRTDASSAARNVSPAPVGSLSPSVAVGR